MWWMMSDAIVQVKREAVIYEAVEPEAPVEDDVAVDDE